MASPQASDPASSQASGSASPQVRFFRGSRPPSPSLFPGMLNLDAVNEKLRQRTATPETQTSETERQRTRKLFDELIELGGIPLRPWVDYRPEDLTDGQRGHDNGDDYTRSLYRRDYEYWQTQLRLWTRFAKRRSQDCEPSLRSLDPVDVAAAFTAYLRGHLQRDTQDRAKPGCEVWSSYSHMTSQRDLIEDIVESLPPAEALLRQLRNEKGDENTLPEVTNEGLIKEYNVPHRRVWMDLWSHSQESLPPSEPESPRVPKRQRDGTGEEEEQEVARPSKRVALDSKPSESTTRSTRQRKQKKRSPILQQDIEEDKPKGRGNLAATAPKTAKNGTKRGKLDPNKQSVAATNGGTRHRPSGTSRGKAPGKKTRQTKKHSQRPGVTAGDGLGMDPAGPRRSARIAARKPQSL